MSATELLTPKEAAERLKTTPGTLNMWRTTKRYPLPYVKVGILVRYRALDIEKFIAARLVSPEEKTNNRGKRGSRISE